MVRAEAAVVIPAGGDAVCVVDIHPGGGTSDARRDDLVRLLTTRFLQLEPRK